MKLTPLTIPRVLLLVLIALMGVPGDSTFTCPAAGDAAYHSSKMLGTLNNMACNATNAHTFTKTLYENSKDPICVTHCASCEEGACSDDGDYPKQIFCTDPDKCTMCVDPPGCDSVSPAAPTEEKGNAGRVIVVVFVLFLVCALCRPRGATPHY